MSPVSAPAVDIHQVDWQALTRRVARGLCTADDALPVEAIGMMPQAIRIRRGLATTDDALLIHLQVQLRQIGPHQGAAA